MNWAVTWAEVKAHTETLSSLCYLLVSDTLSCFNGLQLQPISLKQNTWTLWTLCHNNLLFPSCVLLLLLVVATLRKHTSFKHSRPSLKDTKKSSMRTPVLLMSQARCLTMKLCLEPFSAGRTTMTLNPYVPLPIMARANSMKEVPSVDCRWNCNRNIFFLHFTFGTAEGINMFFNAWSLKIAQPSVLHSSPQDRFLTHLQHWVFVLVLSKKPPWRDDNQPWIHANELWIVWNDSRQWTDYTAGLF